MINKVLQGDCLELMRNIPDKSIDMVLCDLPYGTTACKWDVVIPFTKYIISGKKIMYENEYIQNRLQHGENFEKAKEDFNIIAKDGLWEQYKRIIKDNGAIVLTGAEPFSSLLRCSNLKMYKYDWIYQKNKATNF